jgi:hypothetical protein
MNIAGGWSQDQGFASFPRPTPADGLLLSQEYSAPPALVGAMAFQ